MTGGPRSARHFVSRKVAIHIAGYAMVLAMLAYVASRPELRQSVVDLTADWLAQLAAVAALGLAALGLQFRSAAAVLGARLERREWFGLTAVNTIANYVLPGRAGLALRAAYLSRTHGISLAEYTALTTASLGLIMAVAASTGGVASLATLSGPARARAIAPFAVIAAGMLLGLGVFPLLRLPQSTSVVWITRVQHGLKRYLESGLEAVWLVLWSVSVFLVQAFGLYLAFIAVGADISFVETLIIHSGATIGFLIAITPGGLGIKEGVVVFMTGLIGLDARLALAAALLDRTVILGVTGLAALVTGRGLLRSVTRSAKEQSG